MTEAEPYDLIGADGSPYSCKLRAVMRYRRIPFLWHGSFFKSREVFAKYNIKPAIIPVLIHNGNYMIDSTPMIQRLEEKEKERGRFVVPPMKTANRFLSLLLEDFADEWMTKIMFEGRFHTPKAAQFGARWQLEQQPEAAGSSSTLVPDFAERQRKRRQLVGCENWEVMRYTLASVCSILTSMVMKGEGFLLGGSSPTVADFAVYGQLRQCIIDPLPYDLMVKYPAAFAWVHRLDDLSGYEGDHNNNNELGMGAYELLKLVGDIYLPFLVANERAIQNGEKEVVCSISAGEVGEDGEVTKKGKRVQHRQPPFKYQKLCLEVLRNEFSLLEGKEREKAERVLGETGCLSAFKMTTKL